MSSRDISTAASLFTRVLLTPPYAFGLSQLYMPMMNEIVNQVLKREQEMIAEEAAATAAAPAAPPAAIWGSQQQQPPR